MSVVLLALVQIIKIAWSKTLEAQACVTQGLVNAKRKEVTRLFEYLTAN
jgi:hypothetical protein